MKKLFALFLCTLQLVLLLPSCGERRETLETGFQPDFTCAEYAYSSMVAAEDGYFVALHSKFTFYVDKETLDSVAFCPDPACDHKRDSNCLGFRARSIGALQLYNGELYLKQGNSDEPFSDVLNGVKTDGTGFHTIQELWSLASDPRPDENTGSNFDYPYAILGDYIMFCPRSHMICVGKLGGDIKDAKVLFSYDTGNPCFSDGMAASISAHWMIWVDGGYFYYCGVNYPDAIREGRPSFLVYRYDPLTEENELVWRADEMTDTYSLNGYYIKDGVFYYHIAEHELEDNETGVWKCDLETHKTVKLSDGGGAHYAEFDSDYIYLMDYYAKTITVLDRETGAEIAVLNPSAVIEKGERKIKAWNGDVFPNLEWLGGDDKWIFIECEVDNYSEPGDFVYALYAIAKDELAENNWREAAIFDWDDHM